MLHAAIVFFLLLVFVAAMPGWTYVTWGWAPSIGIAMVLVLILISKGIGII